MSEQAPAHEQERRTRLGNQPVSQDVFHLQLLDQLALVALELVGDLHIDVYLQDSSRMSGQNTSRQVQTTYESVFQGSTLWCGTAAPGRSACRRRRGSASMRLRC